MSEANLRRLCLCFPDLVMKQLYLQPSATWPTNGRSAQKVVGPRGSDRI